MIPRLSSQRRTQIVQAIVPAFLVLCMMLGGASADGVLANAALQLLAIPLLWLAAIRRPNGPLTPTARMLVFFLVLILLLLAVQLIPLPPSLWTALPGRGPIAEGYRMLGVPLPALPISLIPSRTLGAALWLLPAIAVLFAMLRLGAFSRTGLAWFLGAAACASVLLGAVQVAGGPGSAAYLYSDGSVGAATGFFANPNHFGTFILMVIPMLAAVLASVMDRRDYRSRKRNSAVVAVATAMIALLLVGIVINRSLAAIGLILPVAAGSFCIVRWRHRKMPLWVLPLIGLLIAGMVATVVVEPFDNDLTTSVARTEQLSRYTKYVRTVEAIKDYLPVGTGVGTMPTVYRMYENPAEVTRTYASHTHSDPLEIVLDAGIPGAVLIVLFMLGWGWRSFAIWRAAEPDGFARAATVATGAAMAHSLVDYPLRTAAVAAIFTAMLAIMAGARERIVAAKRDADTTVRHLSA